MDGEQFPGETPPRKPTDDEIASEVSRILADGGYSPMPGPPFTGLLCKPIGGGFWMGGVFDPIPGDVDSFHTHMAVPPRDPIEAAHWMVAKKREKMKALGMLAELTTEATLEPPVAETTPDVSYETFDEPVSQDYDSPHVQIDADAEPHRPPAELLNVLAGGGGDPLPSEGHALEDRLHDADPLDADFGDPDPEELGAELLETDFVLDPSLLPEPESQAPAPEPEPLTGQDRFIGLDDLDRRRSLRIGDVYRYARSLMPFWTTDSDTALIELRNFTMGVSEGRWPDDPGRRDELAGLEATLSRLSAITAARDAKVEFLESAGREEIEAFDPEAGWPA